MSGRFERWQGVEFELTFAEGLPEARTLLAGRSIRETLDALCRRAKAAEGHRAIGERTLRQDGNLPGELA